MEQPTAAVPQTTITTNTTNKRVNRQVVQALPIVLLRRFSFFGLFEGDPENEEDDDEEEDSNALAARAESSGEVSCIRCVLQPADCIRAGSPSGPLGARRALLPPAE